MHLKRLTVHGFKSFADRTVFEFPAGGMTCIVGPNGCGKSNVLEAVKWVLGEQRPKSLRSRELTDVIFNGTVRRAPMGLCQGTLTFDNRDRSLPVDADEVEVTRRVNRASETEYLLNRRPLRLKDLRDVFAGTGLGAGGYAFMEQGKIDEVLANNPVDRRKVFEEAAGISRFRARKHEAELKLRRVEDNLDRVGDLNDELERNIRSLRIHAGKARNHREMSARVRSLQERFCVRRWRDIAVERVALDLAREEVAGRRETAEASRAELRAEREVLEHELTDLTEKASEARSRAAALAAEIAREREKLEFHGRYVAEVSERRERRAERLTEEAAAHEQAATERGEQERAYAELEAGRSEREERLRNAESAAKDLGEKVREVQRQRDGLEHALSRASKRASEAGREAARLEAEAQHLEGRATALAERREEIDAEHAAALDAQADREAEREAAEDAQERLAEERDLAEAAAAAAEESASATDAEARECRQEWDEARSRHKSVARILDAGEGLEDGTRVLRRIAAESPERLPGHRGLLLDLLRVPRSEVEPLAQRLGPLAAALVFEEREQAIAALRILREEGAGGVRLLALDAFESEPLRAIGGVQADDGRVARTLGALLAGVRLTTLEELPEALQSEGAASALYVLSEDGTTVRRGGTFEAAASSGAAASLMALRSEFDALGLELPRLEEAAEAAREAVRASREARDRGREALKSCERAVGQQGSLVGKARAEAVAAERAAGRLAQELTRFEGEAESIASKRSLAAERLEQAQEVREQAEEAAGEARGGLEGLRERLDACAAERREADALLEQERIQRATAAERLEASAARGRELEQALARLTRAREEGEVEIANLAAAEASAAETVEQAQEALVKLEAEEGQVGERRAQADAACSEAREAFAELEAALDERTAELETLAGREAKLSGTAGNLEASGTSLAERALTELEIEDLGAHAEALDARWTVALGAAQADVEAESEEAGDAEEEDFPLLVVGSEAQKAPDAAVASAVEAPLAPGDEAYVGPLLPLTQTGLLGPWLPGTTADLAVAPADPPRAASLPEGEEAALVLQELAWLHDEDFDAKGTEREIRTLREKIARLGNVNLAAVEELAEAEERFGFLQRERNDLNTSRRELEKILQEIEERSTAMFQRTFDAVRESFADIFRRLFGGGKAEITLEDPSRPLESGIEIKARPPGKEFRSITLLSGGERTMTAVALLFAIFRSNPAPCAFLDEVDAALDEDNIERFCRMVADFSDRSQFLVVSHSKRTMEASDLLYGVTMPERGVSRRVAVRLAHLDDEGRILDEAAVARETDRADAAQRGEELANEAVAARTADPSALAPGGRGSRVRRPEAEEATTAPPEHAVLEAPAMARDLPESGRDDPTSEAASASGSGALANSGASAVAEGAGEPAAGSDAHDGYRTGPQAEAQEATADDESDADEPRASAAADAEA